MKRALVAIVLAATVTARADDAKLATVLYHEGERLMAEGRYADARAKLEQSLLHLDGLGTRGLIAECDERLGRTATAWLEWRESEARAHGAHQNRRERYARARVEALAAGVAYLTVVANGAVEGQVVERDSAALGAAGLGSPVPVDAGRHVVTARAPVRVSWSAEPTILDGEHRTITVPPLEPLSPPPPAPAPAAPPAPAAAPLPVPAVAEVPPASGQSARRIVGIVGVAVGGAALVASGMVAWAAKSQWDDAFSGASPHCDTMNRCDDVGLTATDAARGKANVASALAVGGGLVAIAGAVLWWTARDDAPPPRAEAAITPTRGGVSVSVGGRF
jgi:hypothetical protein